MNLIDIINKTDLIEVEQKHIKVEDTSALYLRAKRENESLDKSVINEFIFLKLNRNIINKIFSENTKRFKEIQAALLSDIFFSYDNDLRWNLYFILVIESRKDLPEGFNSQEIENDEDYARKFIFTMDETIEFINRGWIDSKESNNKFFSPLNQWIQTLEEEDLVGCLTKDYRSTYIDEYLKGIGINSEEILSYDDREDVSKKEKGGKLVRIKRINIEGFREHCLKNIKSIEPVGVNLIHGTNGSGKTSLLETIELSLTNNIRRITNFKDSISDNISKVFVESISDNGVLNKFSPGQKPSRYKMLEESWYGVPLSRSRPTINENFHRFNYFDSEEAFIFALEESDNKIHNNFNYYDGLSKLVYGEQLLSMEKNFLKFKQQFKDRQKEIFKQLQEKNNKLEKLQNKLNNKNLEMINELPKDNFLEYINQVFLNLSMMENFNNSKINEIINHLRVAKDNIHLINENKYYLAPLTIDNLSREKNTCEIEINNLSNDIESVEVNIEVLNKNVTDLNSSLKKAEYNLHNLRLQQEELRSTEDTWNEISSLVYSVEEYKLSIKELENNKKLIYLIEKVKEELNSIGNFNENILLYKSEDINHQEELLKELREEKNKIIDEIYEVEQYLQDVNRYIIDIKHLGIQYLEDTKSEICPLCNAKHTSNHSLLEKINSINSFSNSEKMLGLLKERKFRIEEAINKFTKEIDIKKQTNREINIIDYLYNLVYKSKLINFTYTEEITERYSFLQEIVNSLDYFRDLTMKIEYELDKSGATRESIEFTEKFIHTNIIFKEFKTAFNNDNSFNEFIINKENVFKDKEITLKEDINKYKLESELLLEKISELNNKVTKMKKIKVEQLNKNIYLIKMINQVESLESFSIPSNYRLDIWANKLKEVLLRLQVWMERINEEKEINYLNKEFKELENEIYTKNLECGRCQKAIDVLESLPLLQNYVVEFVKSNVDKIEKFFRLLHTPREFSELQITEEGIVAKRNSDNTIIKAHQMSNGQRAAFALSVLFTLHLAAKDAPKIIIMDEPVANMDDLHLLNLLDVLRDFAIKGHQIFFTTANPYVSNLFRRKFSFFKDDFKQFEFSRSGDAPTVILERVFTPDKESPIKERIIR